MGRREVMYSITIWHEALGKYQVIRGRTEAEARKKADLKRAVWNDQYARLITRDRKRQNAEDKRAARETLKEEAAERTLEAEEAISELSSVLASIVDASPVFDVSKQRLTGEFVEPRPSVPHYHQYPPEPKPEDWTSVLQFGFLDKLFASRRGKKIRAAEEKSRDAFLERYEKWKSDVELTRRRNLYGTVMAEGATKGIIVTTSGFGPDAHRFARGKPLTLLDGNNLLYLLAKHGTTARIDLAEAKKLGNALARYCLS
jgi:hypothetical protein